jgi:hypothetical protein
MGKVILHDSVESNHIDSHIKFRQALKACEPATNELLRGLFIAEESFEVCSGELDEGLEKVSLLAVVPHRVPESLENFVTFPPVGEVVEVDSVQVIL